MQLDHPDQHPSGALRVNEGVPAARVAERVSHELPAGSGDLRASIIQILNLKSDVVQA